jgi:isochorismate synthase EntC
MIGGVRLFAGGGIVEGSEPEAEWMETEAKIEAIEATLA